MAPWLTSIAMGLALAGEPRDPYLPPDGAEACLDLDALEADAELGRLDEATEACLEHRYEFARCCMVFTVYLRDGVERQRPSARTSRWQIMDRVSRLLLADARRDGGEPHGRLLARHLQEVDPGDAHLCLEYARWLSTRGPERSQEVVKYAERALEHREDFDPEAREARVAEATRHRDEASRPR